MGIREFFRTRETDVDRPPVKPSSLADLISAGPMPVREALHYAIATAEAVRGAHMRGRAYALLQPAGIAIDNERVQLVPSLPAAVTPYSSPEQVKGQQLDFRSDIFSLGALLYEMLSGRKAFEAETKPALRFEILGAEPAPLKGLPPGLSQLVMRCLEKEPERRVQRMEILLAALKLQEITAPPAANAAGQGPVRN